MWDLDLRRESWAGLRSRHHQCTHPSAPSVSPVLIHCRHQTRGRLATFNSFCLYETHSLGDYYYYVNVPRTNFYFH